MDQKDVEICKMLAIDSRTSYRAIGDVLGLSVNSVHKRVQTLVSNGIIQRFVLAPSLKMLDSVVVMVFGVSQTDNMKSTLRELGSNNNTYKVVLATGNYLYVHGVLRRVSEMEKFISFVKKKGQMPNPRVGIVSSPEGLDYPLSKIDYCIIRSMAFDSRKDFSDVAQELEISTRTVKRRFQRMQEDGLVHPSIEFNPSASSAVICMFHLELKDDTDKTEAIAHIQNKHKSNTLSVAGLDNIPELLFFSSWASNMKELRDLQDSIEASGYFASAVPHIFYNTLIFESWKDRVIQEGAESC